MSERLKQYLSRDEDESLDMVERWAIRLALGNNGGSWATHYTEEQKIFWRELAEEFIDEVEESLDDY